MATIDERSWILDCFDSYEDRWTAAGKWGKAESEERKKTLRTLGTETLRRLLIMLLQ